MTIRGNLKKRDLVKNIHTGYMDRTKIVQNSASQRAGPGKP